MIGRAATPMRVNRETTVIGVPPQRVLTIIHGHRAVTADIKWRRHLSRAAGAIQKKSLAVNLTRHGKDCGTLNTRSRKI